MKFNEQNIYITIDIRAYFEINKQARVDVRVNREKGNRVGFDNNEIA